MRFIDTHTHIYTEEFVDDGEDVVRSAIEAGAEALLLPNIDANSLPQVEALCKKWLNFCFPMIGLHPTEITEESSDFLQEIGNRLSKSESPFIAIGEVGIDLYWDASKREEQIKVFAKQIEWSIQYKLPLVIHSRSAHREIMETLTPFRQNLLGGIFHCFSGTIEEANEILYDFPNFYFGIGGVVTFKNSILPQVLQSCIPLEKIVVETDAPYLAPVPYRGKRNEPKYILSILNKLADIYGVEVDKVAEVTTRNVYHLFPSLKCHNMDLKEKNNYMEKKSNKNLV